MYQPEPDQDKAQRHANLLLLFIIGVLSLVAIFAISQCSATDQSSRTVYATTTREVTRVVEVPVEVVHEIVVTREVAVPVEVTREVEVFRNVEVPVEVLRETEIIKNVEVPVEVVHEIVVTREVAVPVEVTREVEVTRVVVATPTATPIPSPTHSPTSTPTATPSPTPGPPSTPAELVERVRDSVVRVEAGTGGFLSFTSSGSGFIFEVEGTTAFVATNHHLIDGKGSVEVQLGDSSTYDALVLGWDAERDVAVLSICCSSEFVALPWGDATPSEGETVVAVGYPIGDTDNLITTIGEVLAPDDLSIEHDFIPHSAPLNPGNSGGPLFSMPSAEVVGINTARGTEILAFYAVPYHAVAQQAADWRSQLIIEPTATPIFTSGDAVSEFPTSFEPGTHIVGKDIAPGEYRAKSKYSKGACEWKRLNSLGGESGSTNAFWWSGTSNEGYTYTTILPTDFAFSSEGCTQWESTDAIHENPMPRPIDSFDGGTHIVGIHIEPGLYKSGVATRRCRWVRLSSTDGGHSSEIGYESVAEGTVYVTIEPTDYAFHSDGCTTWVKQ